MNLIINKQYKFGKNHVQVLAIEPTSRWFPATKVAWFVVLNAKSKVTNPSDVFSLPESVWDKYLSEVPDITEPGDSQNDPVEG